jgi:hypothetical protein
MATTVHAIEARDATRAPDLLAFVIFLLGASAMLVSVIRMSLEMRTSNMAARDEALRVKGLGRQSESIRATLNWSETFRAGFTSRALVQACSHRLGSSGNCIARLIARLIPG